MMMMMHTAPWHILHFMHPDVHTCIADVCTKFHLTMHTDRQYVDTGHHATKLPQERIDKTSGTYVNPGLGVCIVLGKVGENVVSQVIRTLACKFNIQRWVDNHG